MCWWVYRLLPSLAIMHKHGCHCNSFWKVPRKGAELGPGFPRTLHNDCTSLQVWGERNPSHPLWDCKLISSLKGNTACVGRSSSSVFPPLDTACLHLHPRSLGTLPARDRSSSCTLDHIFSRFWPFLLLPIGSFPLTYILMYAV